MCPDNFQVLVTFVTAAASTILQYCTIKEYSRLGCKFWDLACLVGLNGYFLMCSRFAGCSNHLQLMPRKKKFSFPSPPRKDFLSSSPLGVMFLSLDLICSYVVMSTYGSTIMLVIF
jgi:hypothetical protein